MQGSCLPAPMQGTPWRRGGRPHWTWRPAWSRRRRMGCADRPSTTGTLPRTSAATGTLQSCRRTNRIQMPGSSPEWLTPSSSSPPPIHTCPTCRPCHTPTCPTCTASARRILTTRARHCLPQPAAPGTLFSLGGARRRTAGTPTHPWHPQSAVLSSLCSLFAVAAQLLRCSIRSTRGSCPEPPRWSPPLPPAQAAVNSLRDRTIPPRPQTPTWRACRSRGSSKVATQYSSLHERSSSARLSRFAPGDWPARSFIRPKRNPLQYTRDHLQSIYTIPIITDLPGFPAHVYMLRVPRLSIEPHFPPRHRKDLDEILASDKDPGSGVDPKAAYGALLHLPRAISTEQMTAVEGRVTALCQAHKTLLGLVRLGVLRLNRWSGVESGRSGVAR